MARLLPHTHTLLHNHSYFQHFFAALTPSTFRQPPLASSLTCLLTFDLTHFSRWPTLYLTHILWLNLTYTHYCTTLFLFEILWDILLIWHTRTVRPPWKKTSPECTGGAPLKSDSQQEISPKNIPNSKDVSNSDLPCREPYQVLWPEPSWKLLLNLNGNMESGIPVGHHIRNLSIGTLLECLLGGIYDAFLSRTFSTHTQSGPRHRHRPAQTHRHTGCTHTHMHIIVLQADGSGDSDTPMTDLLLGLVAQGLAGLLCANVDWCRICIFPFSVFGVGVFSLVGSFHQLLSWQSRIEFVPLLSALIPWLNDTSFYITLGA